MKRLFGTDGIRGKANHYPITAEVALAAGRALVSVCGTHKDNTSPTVVLGRDTRISGQMLAAALTAGVLSLGGRIIDLGIVPTPAVAWALVQQEGDAGVVISASHNPFADNGIKFFDRQGYKLDDTLESEVENAILDTDLDKTASKVERIGQWEASDSVDDDYVDFLIQSVPAVEAVADMRIVIDCANGATSMIAPRLFQRLGADLTSCSTAPDGVNINLNCGSEHPDILSQIVVENKADFGLAFDGDGDRVIAVDEKGSILSGDQVIAILAEHLQHSGRLNPASVVTTVMSNIGLKTRLEALGIAHKITDVGDRRVMEKMRASGAVLGGEDSGHIIFSPPHTTGDGILSGLELAAIVANAKVPLSELAQRMRVFPQVLINVPVRAKPPLKDIVPVSDAIAAAENQLGQTGRVLVRYSGTQSVCRVMVEGPTDKETEHYAQKLSAVISEYLG